MESISSKFSDKQRIRLAYGLLIGQIAELQTVQGDVFEGVVYSVATSEQKVVLKSSVRKHTSGSNRKSTSHAETLQQPRKASDSHCVADLKNYFPGATIVISMNDIQSLMAKSISTGGNQDNETTKDLQKPISNTNSSSKNTQVDSNVLKRGFMTDTAISAQKRAGALHGRELEAWVPPEDSNPLVSASLESGRRGGKWDQFEANREKFGIVAHFDEELYTTPLDRNSDNYKRHEREAIRLARDIEGASSSNPHVLEERNRMPAYGEDSYYNDNDEDKYGAVIRDEDNWRSGKWRTQKPSIQKPVQNPGVSRQTAELDDLSKMPRFQEQTFNQRNVSQSVNKIDKPRGDRLMPQTSQAQHLSHHQKSDNMRNQGPPPDHLQRQQRKNSPQPQQNGTMKAALISSIPRAIPPISPYPPPSTVAGIKASKISAQQPALNDKSSDRIAPQQQVSDKKKIAVHERTSQYPNQNQTLVGETKVGQNIVSSNPDAAETTDKDKTLNYCSTSKTNATLLIDTAKINDAYSNSIGTYYHPDNYENFYYPLHRGEFYAHHHPSSPYGPAQNFPPHLNDREALLREEVMEKAKEYTEKLRSEDSLLLKPLDEQVAEMPSLFHFCQNTPHTNRYHPVNDMPIGAPGLSPVPVASVSAIASPILASHFLYEAKNLEAELEMLVASEKSKKFDRIKQTVASFKEFSETYNSRPSIKKSNAADLSTAPHCLPAKYSSQLESNSKSEIINEKPTDEHTNAMSRRKQQTNFVASRNEMCDSLGANMKSHGNNSQKDLLTKTAVSPLKANESDNENMRNKKPKFLKAPSSVAEKTALEPATPFAFSQREALDDIHSSTIVSTKASSASTNIAPDVSASILAAPAPIAGGPLKLNRDAPEFIPLSLRPPMGATVAKPREHVNTFSNSDAALSNTKTVINEPQSTSISEPMNQRLWPRCIFRCDMPQQREFDFANHVMPPNTPAYNLPPVVEKKPRTIPIYKKLPEDANVSIMSVFACPQINGTTVAHLFSIMAQSTGKASAQNQSEQGESNLQQNWKWETMNPTLSTRDIVNFVYELPKTCTSSVAPEIPIPPVPMYPVIYEPPPGQFPLWIPNQQLPGLFVGPDGGHYAQPYINRSYPSGPPPPGLPPPGLPIGVAYQQGAMIGGNFSNSVGQFPMPVTEDGYTAMHGPPPPGHNQGTYQFSNLAHDETGTPSHIDVTYPPPRTYTHGHFNGRGRGTGYRSNYYRRPGTYSGYRQNMPPEATAEGTDIQSSYQTNTLHNHHGNYSYTSHGRYDNRQYQGNYSQQNQAPVGSGTYQLHYHNRGGNGNADFQMESASDGYRGGRPQYADHKSSHGGQYQYNKNYNSAQHSGYNPQPENSQYEHKTPGVDDASGQCSSSQTNATNHFHEQTQDGQKHPQVVHQQMQQQQQQQTAPPPLAPSLSAHQPPHAEQFYAPTYDNCPDDQDAAAQEPNIQVPEKYQSHGISRPGENSNFEVPQSRPPSGRNEGKYGYEKSHFHKNETRANFAPRNPHQGTLQTGKPQSTQQYHQSDQRGHQRSSEAQPPMSELRGLQATSAPKGAQSAPPGIDIVPKRPPGTNRRKPQGFKN